MQHFGKQQVSAELEQNRVVTRTCKVDSATTDLARHHAAFRIYTSQFQLRSVAARRLRIPSSVST
jgi:hypothetical protein